MAAASATAQPTLAEGAGSAASSLPCPMSTNPAAPAPSSTALHRTQAGVPPKGLVTAVGFF